MTEFILRFPGPVELRINASSRWVVEDFARRMKSAMMALSVNPSTVTGVEVIEVGPVTGWS